MPDALEMQAEVERRASGVSHAVLIRNSQATAMFKSSLALVKIMRELEDGPVKRDLERIARYLRDSAL